MTKIPHPTDPDMWITRIEFGQSCKSERSHTRFMN